MTVTLTDGYIRRDPNGESRYDNLDSLEDGVILPEGVFMPSSAFRNSVPTTQYTMQELGVDLAASPFAPDVVPIPETNRDIVVIRPTEVNWQAETPESSTQGNMVDSINETVKQYWGIILIGGVILAAGILIGRRGQ